MIDLLYKPYYEYTLFDSLIILGVCIIGIFAYYCVRLAILGIKLYFQNRRK